MNKDELWKALIERYPDFADDEHIVKQRARGLRGLLDQAWDEGHTKGIANGKAIESMIRDKSTDRFGKLFGI